MKRLSSALVVLVSATVFAQGDAKRELEKLRGTWAVTSAGGHPLPAGVHGGLILSGDKYQGVEGGKVNEGGTIKVDTTTTPIAFDFAISEGTHAGKTQLGRIVELTNETMTLVLAEPGGTVRPDATSLNKLVLAKIKPLAKQLEGAWEGAISAGGASLRVVVNLSNGADGLATGTMVSVDQGNAETRIAAVVQEGSRIRLIVPAVRGTYEGELKDTELVGTWTQGRGSLPLVLKRRP